MLVLGVQVFLIYNIIEIFQIILVMFVMVIGLMLDICSFRIYVIGLRFLVILYIYVCIS